MDDRRQRAVTFAVGCKATCRWFGPAAAGHWQDAGRRMHHASAALRQNARRAACHRHFCCRGAAGAKLPDCSTSWHCWRAGADYIFERLETSLAARAPRRHTDHGPPLEARAMALNHVTLDDKYDLAKSRIFVTGFQAHGAALPDAEGARPPRRPQHRGLRHRLSRLAARHARPAVHPRAALARQVRHHVSRPASTRTSPRPRCGARSRRSCAAKASSTACSASGTARAPASTAPATCSATPISPAPRSTAACSR